MFCLEPYIRLQTHHNIEDTWKNGKSVKGGLGSWWRSTIEVSWLLSVGIYQHHCLAVITRRSYNTTCYTMYWKKNDLLKITQTNGPWSFPNCKHVCNDSCLCYVKQGCLEPIIQWNTSEIFNSTHSNQFQQSKTKNCSFISWISKAQVVRVSYSLAS